MLIPVLLQNAGIYLYHKKTKVYGSYLGLMLHEIGFILILNFSLSPPQQINYVDRMRINNFLQLELVHYVTLLQLGGHKNLLLYCH